MRSRAKIPPGAGLFLFYLSVVRPYPSVTLLIVIVKMDDLGKTSFIRAELEFFAASVDLIENARTDGRCLKRRVSFEELQQEAIKIKEDHPLKQKQEIIFRRPEIFLDRSMKALMRKNNCSGGRLWWWHNGRVLAFETADLGSNPWSD